MRAKISSLVAGAALLAVVAIPNAGRATEGAAGHYIIGSNAGPGAGIVPPEPGLYWGVQTLYYQGSLDRSVQLPLAGRVQSGLNAGFFSTSIAGLYVPKLDLGNFSLGFGLALPLQNSDVRIFSGMRERSESSWSFGDMVITPAALGYRSGANFFQARLDIFAPTGNYSTSSIANVGMNYWGFVPNISYTRLGQNYDISINAGIDINTRNEATGYTSGAMFHLDASAIHDVAPGFGLGLLASMMSQVQDDRGGLAGRLGGFRGQSFSVGPIARYNFALGGTHLSTVASWAPEFGVENRPSGNAFQFRVSGQF